MQPCRCEGKLGPERPLPRVMDTEPRRPEGVEPPRLLSGYETPTGDLLEPRAQSLTCAVRSIAEPDVRNGRSLYVPT